MDECLLSAGHGHPRHDPNFSNDAAAQYCKSRLVFGTVMSGDRLFNRRKLNDRRTLLLAGLIRSDRRLPRYDTPTTRFYRRY